MIAHKTSASQNTLCLLPEALRSVLRSSHCKPQTLPVNLGCVIYLRQSLPLHCSTDAANCNPEMPVWRCSAVCTACRQCPSSYISACLAHPCNCSPMRILAHMPTSPPPPVAGMAAAPDVSAMLFAGSTAGSSVLDSQVPLPLQVPPGCSDPHAPPRIAAEREPLPQPWCCQERRQCWPCWILVTKLLAPVPVLTPAAAPGCG